MNTIKIASIVLASLVLANCGGGGGGGSETPSSQASSSTPPSTVQSSSSEAQSSEVIESSSSEAQSSSSEAASSSSLSAEEQAKEEQIRKGMGVYVDPVGGSRFACVDCHALEEDSNGAFVGDGYRRAGHSISDAWRRPSFKNGQLSEFYQAANSCLDEWMAAKDDNGMQLEWDAQSEDYLALIAFLESEDKSGETGEAPAISYTLKPTDIPNLVGDVSRGQDTFNETCAVCHGKNAVLNGNRRGIDIRYVNTAFTQRVVDKVRRSGQVSSEVYDGLIGGIMPFWAEDQITDQELMDIIAFLDSADPNVTPVQEEVEVPISSCSSTSPRIGQKAELGTIMRPQHGVSGTVEIIDDCTIRIENFNYDGEGIRVQFYGSNGTQFRENQGGFSVTPTREFLRQGNPYVNETLEVNLTFPEGKSIDDLNSISLWCVTFNADFGAGVFR